MVWQQWLIVMEAVASLAVVSAWTIARRVPTRTPAYRIFSLCFTVVGLVAVFTLWHWSWQFVVLLAYYVLDFITTTLRKTRPKGPDREIEHPLAALISAVIISAIPIALAVTGA